MDHRRNGPRRAGGRRDRARRARACRSASAGSTRACCSTRRSGRMFPERVLAADADAVTLAPGGLALQPGTWGLRWTAGMRCSVRCAPPAGPAWCGRCWRVTAAGRDAGDVGRRRVRPGPGGARAGVQRGRRATPLGPCPAWYVPGAGRRHLGGPRPRAGRPAARRRCGCCPRSTRWACPPRHLLPQRRGAPASPDGRYHLGDTEWLDLEAADDPRGRGRRARSSCSSAGRWGAAIIGALLSRSALASRVAALVWDAPLVDWRATLRQQARIRHLPPALTVLTTRCRRAAASASTSTGST